MKHQEPNITKYSYSNDTGNAQAIVYHLFPGVEIVYVSVHMADFDFALFEPRDRKNYAFIYYCREGRIEQETDNEFFYLMPGDCSVVLADHTQKTFRLPLKHYRGICIGIDLGLSPSPLMDFLESCGCHPHEALKHICGETSHTVFRSPEWARKVFEEPYEIDTAPRPLDPLRVTLPELFYRMKHSKTDSRFYDCSMVSGTQVELVKCAEEYISKHIHDKITVKQLTLEFGVSNTYLQNAFRSVHGMPVIRFIRVQKMQRAAQALIHTTLTIDEIAGNFGYENESKFSAAFKKIMGVPPGLYRKKHAKVKII